MNAEKTDRRTLLLAIGGGLLVPLAGCSDRTGVPGSGSADDGTDADDDGTDAGDGTDADDAHDSDAPTDGETGREPDDAADDVSEDDTDDDGDDGDIPQELPTDPADEDFVDLTGRATVEIQTRHGGDDEPAFVFDPPFVLVDQGTTIRWVNADGVFHTITSTDSLENRSGGGDEFDETIAAEGEAFEWTAAEVGRQDYYCSPHAGFMFGSIEVV